MDSVVLLIVNGVTRELAVPPGRSLLTVLREQLGLVAAKPGCGEGECGACTVLVDGEPVTARGAPRGGGDRTVRTVEGLAAGGQLHPVQQAFLDVGAFQCGYCTAGMVMSVVALLEREPDPDDAQVREALHPNACRCCTYPRILRAVRPPGWPVRKPRAWSRDRPPPRRRGRPSRRRRGRGCRGTSRRPPSATGSTCCRPACRRGPRAGAFARHVDDERRRVAPRRRRRSRHRVHGQGRRGPGQSDGALGARRGGARVARRRCGSSWATPISARTTRARSAAARCPTPGRSCGPRPRPRHAHSSVRSTRASAGSSSRPPHPARSRSARGCRRGRWRAEACSRS